MMPEECESIRSIARWVLPVFVGPKTAVTRVALSAGRKIWLEERKGTFTVIGPGLSPLEGVLLI